MTDRDKVIQGLKVCSDGFKYVSRKCTNTTCPYSDGVSCGIYRLLKDALKIAEENVPSNRSE